MKIILDACSNHNGDMDTIRKMIESAASIGADYIKFQLFDADKLRKDYPDYQNRYEYYKKVMLHYEHVSYIECACKEYGIKPLYTVFNTDVAKSLSEFTSNDIVKIASPDCNNWRLIDTCLDLYKEVIISTGMHEGYQIKQVLKRYKGRQHDKITMLFCRSLYPTGNEYNYADDVQTLKWLKYNFDKWGISDHGDGLSNILEYIKTISEIFYPDYIERHFTLKHDPANKDDAVSSTPDEAIALTGLPFPLLSESEKAMAKLYIGKWGE